MSRGRAMGVVVVTGMALMSLGCEQLPWESGTSESGNGGQSTAPSNPGESLTVPLDERVAVVNEKAISTTDVELAVIELKRLTEAYEQTWEPLPTEDLPDAVDLHDVVNNIITAELKAQDAKARGLDRRTEIQRRMRYLLRTFYAREWDRWQRERALPSEEDIHTFYEQNKQGFRDPERIHVRQIVSETLAEAEAVRSRAVQGEIFAQLAREESVGAGKGDGGDIGWLIRALDAERLRLIGRAFEAGVLFAQLESVAFTLEPQQVSQPVKGPDERYYIVQLEERQEGRQQTELEVRDTIQELLALNKMQRQFGQLNAEATIERYAEHLTAVVQ